MIGECSSLGPRKNSLNLINLIFSLVAGIFMIVACASYSANIKTVQNLSFMVLTTGIEMKLGTNTYSSKTCSYVGLQASCTALCGTNVEQSSDGKGTVEVAKDDQRRSCETGIRTPSVDTAGKVTYTYVPSLLPYKATYDLAQCDKNKDAKTCKDLSTCITGGNVTMAFAVIGCIGCLFSMVIFAWRMNGDGTFAKLISVIFSTGTFISCVVAFSAFQPCATAFYDNGVVATASQVATYVLSGATLVGEPSFSVRPGVGGDMAVCAFVFFIYVMLMALFIPGATAASADAGLDSKAPQV